MKRHAAAILWLAFVFCVVQAMQGRSPLAPAATAAVYVHEKSDTQVPTEVQTALDKLNREGIVATVFDVDTTDGTGDTPDQYKAALAAAKEAGLPALVVMAGDTPIEVVSDPQTESDVLEAVK